MEICITIEDKTPRSQALAFALDTYNKRNPELTPDAFVKKMIYSQLDSLVESYLVKKITSVQFLQRLTAEERIAIRAAASADGTLNDSLQMLAAGTVDLTAEVTIAFVRDLEARGLIAQGRAGDVLALPRSELVSA